MTAELPLPGDVIVKSSSPPKKKEAPPSEDLVDRVLHELTKATDADRKRLEGFLGIDLPVVPERIKSGARIWGYYCRNCGAPDALVFLGDVFIDLGGTERDRPPENMPIEKIPWIQDGGIGDFFDLRPARYHSDRRNRPVCQRCGLALHFNQGGIDRNRMIHLSSWKHDVEVAKKSKSRRQKIVDYYASSGQLERNLDSLSAEIE